MSRDSTAWRNTKRRDKKVRNANTPSCHVALEWLQCCLISVGYVRTLCNRRARYMCRMYAPEVYTMIQILLGDTAFPQPVVIIQLSTHFLLVLKLNVCRCKGKFYFRTLFMAVLRLHWGFAEATERSPIGWWWGRCSRLSRLCLLLYRLPSSSDQCQRAQSACHEWRLSHGYH